MLVHYIPTATNIIYIHILDSPGAELGNQNTPG